MPSIPIGRLVHRDPEARTLRALAQAVERLPRRRHPDDALQLVVDLARGLTRAKYGALSVTDEYDRAQGFVVSGIEPERLRRLPSPPQGHGPLGSLREDGRPVRYEDVREHARAFGFPPQHPEMRRMLGVAIWVHGAVRGSLYVTDRRDDCPFDDDDECTLVTLARHAGQVIESEWY
jgi:GAF domain-containing protein